MHPWMLISHFKTEVVAVPASIAVNTKEQLILFVLIEQNSVEVGSFIVRIKHKILL